MNSAHISSLIDKIIWNFKRDMSDILLVVVRCNSFILEHCRQLHFALVDAL